MHDHTPVLFRGDAGLPPGVMPASPLFQLRLRKGSSFTDANAHCHLLVKFIADQDRDGDADLVDFVEDSTHLQTPQNPFVSFTTDLQTAKRYASMGHGTSSRPYITVVVPRDSRRVVDFRARLTVTSKARANKEVGVVGILEPGEIRFRVYVDTLDSEIEKQIVPWAFQPAGIALPPWSIPENDLTAVFSSDYCCPNCRQALPYYFRRNLGADTEKILECDTSDYQRPFFRPSDESYLSCFLSKRPSVLDMMVENGSICRCSNCDAYLRAATPPRANLVTVALKKTPVNPAVVITNHNYVALTAALIGVHVESGGERRNLIAKFLFGPGANRVDTSWPRIEQMLKSLNMSDGFAAEILERMLEQDPMLEPSDSRELPLPIPDTVRAFQVRDVTVLRATFESGDVWSPPSAFDVEWDGLLDTWE